MLYNTVSIVWFPRVPADSSGPGEAEEFDDPYKLPITQEVMLEGEPGNCIAELFLRLDLSVSSFCSSRFAAVLLIVGE